MIGKKYFCLFCNSEFRIQWINVPDKVSEFMEIHGANCPFCRNKLDKDALSSADIGKFLQNVCIHSDTKKFEKIFGVSYDKIWDIGQELIEKSKQ